MSRRPYRIANLGDRYLILDATGLPVSSDLQPAPTLTRDQQRDAAIRTVRSLNGEPALPELGTGESRR